MKKKYDGGISVPLKAVKCRWSSYLFTWAVYLCIPLLAVQTHLDALAEEETRPHDDVERRVLTLVVHGKIEDH